MHETLFNTGSAHYWGGKRRSNMREKCADGRECQGKESIRLRRTGKSEEKQHLENKVLSSGGWAHQWGLSPDRDRRLPRKGKILLS